MTLKLTLDVFSGRPNASIDLTAQESADLIARLSPVGKTTSAPAAEVFGLGYRGILIEQTAPVSASLPKTFRLTGGQVVSAAKVLKTVDPTIEQSLLSNTALLARGGISKTVAAAIVAQSAVASSSATPPSTTVAHPPACRCAPLYEPAWWNDLSSGGTRQITNNCYNYACNYRTDTFAQPGRGASAMYTAFNCAALRTASCADTLIEAAAETTKITCPGEGHLVALVIWPNVDFHWYRMGRDGLWSHKPGGYPVTNIDNGGKLIPDPRSANRGPYVNFCEFMIVMNGHVKIE